ncbi:gas vesicle protein [Gelidibacter sediminis]|uniref:Gas vesicle protein n=1 Tax=Gelidibacter sediminis TaxID=1608710 RepID=A0A4R7PX94_9FLAO|nr:YtxH domain-containing protein [Gelidibacter sediminis]TDU39565.1 gas vesicle protein [Gelidibacter sediminis]
MGNNSSNNTLIGILAGTAIGATLGILFAPDKGVNIRQKISDEAISAKDRLAESALAAKDNLATRASHLRDNIVDTVSTKKLTLDEQVESIVSDASHKTEDVITTLEKKLAALKDKNKKLQKF